MGFFSLVAAILLALAALTQLSLCGSHAARRACAARAAMEQRWFVDKVLSFADGVFKVRLVMASLT